MMDNASFQQKPSIQPLINNVGWELIFSRLMAQI